MDDADGVIENTTMSPRIATGDLSDIDLVAALGGTDRQHTLVVLQTSRLLDAVDRRGCWRDDGSKALWAWYARLVGCSDSTAKTAVWFMRALRQAPLTKTALQAGALNVDCARVLVGCATSRRKVVADAFPAAEELLLSYSGQHPYSEFVRLVRYWESVVDQDGEEDQGQSDYQSRHLHASETLRGMVRIDGTLDAVQGAIFLTTLRRIEQELFRADSAAARDLYGAGASADLVRSPAQRRADALAEMAIRASTAPADGKHPAPRVVVHCGEGTIARLCELASGATIAPGLIVPYLGDAEIERIVYGPKSRVIDLSETARFITGGLRRLVQLRDRWCQHGTCNDTSDDGGHVDHIRPRTKGGSNDQDNLRWACDTHNWWWWNNQQRFLRHLHELDPPHPHDTG